mmetsp:Transcript_23703/g.35157  ORF Transcript_23703/g.35157 Transcript_23703/m.35157 type:complete len:87 (+) Transcript_23703:98-358(+)
MSSPSSSLSMCRSLLREAHKMSDYNFRSYAARRVKAGFRKNSLLQGQELAAAVKYGEEQLAVLKRQVIIGNLYPSDTSVMDFKIPA